MGDTSDIPGNKTYRRENPRSRANYDLCMQRQTAADVPTQGEHEAFISELGNNNDKAASNRSYERMEDRYYSLLVFSSLRLRAKACHRKLRRIFLTQYYLGRYC